MLEPQSFLIELTENFGGELLPDGRVKFARDKLEACATKRGATVTVSHAKNFELGVNIPTISVRRIDKMGSKTETEILFFSYEEEGGAMVTDPEKWGRVPVQIFG